MTNMKDDYTGAFRRTGRRLRADQVAIFSEDEAFKAMQHSLQKNGLLNEISDDDVRARLQGLPELISLEVRKSLQQREWQYRRLIASRHRQPQTRASHNDGEGTPPPTLIRTVIDQAKSAKIRETAAYDPELLSPQCRALLPSVSLETFQANRRLVAALSAGVQIDDLHKRIAEHIAGRGKQGFSDIRDFFRALNKVEDVKAADLFTAIRTVLTANRHRRLLNHLMNDTAPQEGDFR